MNNNFNLKSFLAEGKLLNETSSDLKKIFDLYSQNVVDIEFHHLKDEEKQQVQDAFNGAKYSTIDELIDSIYNVEGELADIMGHYPSDFTEQTAENLAEICDEINFPNKLGFLHAFLKHGWDSLNWDEEDRENSWKGFLDQIGETEED
jgi:hypothetical protein